MRPTDFSKRLTDFLTGYLPGERGASKNTIASYRDTFILLLTFLKESKGISAERLTLCQITKEIVVEFLGWLEKERHCSAATRNVRLAALHSFFKYLQYQTPESLAEWQRILSIPVKRTEKPAMNYLSVEGMRLLLEGPDQSTRNGRRDLALLSLMYDSGARVQEIIDLTPSMVRLDPPCTVKLIGKGNKARIVPLLEQQVEFLKIYMTENKLLVPFANMYPLFCNSRKEKLTRAGVNYILTKYANRAREKEPSLIPEKFSCHGMRHSKAMQLLQSGVNLVYIRDILGHSSVQVTEIYARTDSHQKREAIEKAYSDVSPKEAPPWLTNDNLLSWLKSFNQ
ncbi:site-specific integrase [Alicyclobacillus curvatus]|nr:site-specific integrase [Alicyclobacillus curvatus]